LERKSLNIDKLWQGGSRAKGSRVGDDLVEAVEEMAKHLRGEIELEAHDLWGGAMTPAQIEAIRLNVASLHYRERIPLRSRNCPLTIGAACEQIT
jgi:hypothetical protein